MRLWTHQPISAIEDLISGKPYICNQNKSVNLTDPLTATMFKNAYDWISGELNLKSPKPENVTYPIWGYARYNNLIHKPNLQSSEFHLKNQLSVMIEVDIPDEDVLLSSFDSWHLVLNDAYISPSLIKFNSFESEDIWNKKVDKEELIYNKASDADKIKLKYESWKSILMDKPYGEFYIQGIFWAINPEDVVDYTLLKPAKKYRK